MKKLTLFSISLTLIFSACLSHASVGQRYTEYLKHCKSFRLKQMQNKKLKDIPDKIKKCRHLAEIYAELKPNTELTTKCALTICHKKDEKENCESKAIEHAGYRENTCRRVLAPLECMKSEKTPYSIQWSYDQRRGKLSCDRI